MCQKCLEYYLDKKDGQYSIIEYKGNHFTLIDSGAILTKAGESFPDRLVKIYDDLKENPQETLTGMRDTALDFSAEKFNEIKEKFDSGEISADKAKEFLLSKRDLIMEKVDSGELSKGSVVDFFNDTKDAVVEKINN